MSWGMLLLVPLPNCKKGATSNFFHFWFCFVLWGFFDWLGFLLVLWGDFVVLFGFPLYFHLHVTSMYFLAHMAGMLLWQWIARFRQKMITSSLTSAHGSMESPQPLLSAQEVIQMIPEFLQLFNTLLYKQTQQQLQFISCQLIWGGA